jgi:hypothetical protein
VLLIVTRYVVYTDNWSYWTCNSFMDLSTLLISEQQHSQSLICLQHSLLEGSVLLLTLLLVDCYFTTNSLSPTADSHLPNMSCCVRPHRKRTSPTVLLVILFIWCENIHLMDNRQLDYPVPGGNKYRYVTLQVGGVSKTESIKCTQLKTTDPTSRQRRRPTSLNQ